MPSSLLTYPTSGVPWRTGTTDTLLQGMHALGWTRQEAVDYILQYTAQSALEAENEVDRYITWPGQALAYKSGQLQISSFRSSAEQQLGSEFDIKDFHDVILDSLGPMSVVEEEVNEWIASTLNP
ncbi:uncharacterized protein LOC125177893 [Hyalella azteca]|uniref:Uncharacterized protein LOC125177893 n=1 Tax=Hyalella azteca TaxID=294128 RepID=A0A979FIQ0_HYAAZ|nr:uncharacterized protein LOC125177893 [Hyalella azteca]